MINLNQITVDQIKEFLKDEKYRSYVILGAVAFFAIIYLTFGIMPKFTEFARTSRKVNELKNNVELVETRMERLDEMTVKLKALRKEFEGYSEGIPDEKNIPRFLEEVSGIAKKSNVKILSITPAEFRDTKTETKNGDFYKEMPINLTGKSGYHQLGEFLANIEQAKRFITIEKLEIEQDNKFPMRHNVDMVFKTYVSVDDKKR